MKPLAIFTPNFTFLPLRGGWVICLFFIFPVTVWGQFHIPEELLFSLQEEIGDTITENTKPKEKTNIYIVEGTTTYNLVENPAVQITWLTAEPVKEKAELAVSKPKPTRPPDIEKQKNTEPVAVICSVPVSSDSFVVGGRNAKLINVQQRDYRLKTATVYEPEICPWESPVKKQITENAGLSDISKYRSQNYFTRPPPGLAG